jgi:hypothetical protein
MGFMMIGRVHVGLETLKQAQTRGEAHVVIGWNLKPDPLCIQVSMPSEANKHDTDKIGMCLLSFSLLLVRVRWKGSRQPLPAF